MGRLTAAAPRKGPAGLAKADAGPAGHVSREVLEKVAAVRARGVVAQDSVLVAAALAARPRRSGSWSTP
ncbi:MAG: hypothetical protein ACKOWG_10950 [Planctomycetia bacterium]